MTRAHTPGPWRLSQERDGYVFVSSPTHAHFARVVNTCDDGTDESANARLIAAAPDLLAAVKDCYRRLWDKDSGLAKELPDVARAKVLRALIARIEEAADVPR